MPMRATCAFGAALLLTTLAMLLPSLPFRLGLFEFYTLSWFHLYVAAGSAAAALALACFARSKRNIALLAVLAFVLLLPLRSQIARSRARSLRARSSAWTPSARCVRLRTWRVARPAGSTLSLMYSLLHLAAAVHRRLLRVEGWQERATRACSSGCAACSVWRCCVTQLRMHYFGSFALYLPWLVLAQSAVATLAGATQADHAVRLRWLRAGVLDAGTLPAAGPMHGAGGRSRTFRALRPILEDLQQACAEEPGHRARRQRRRPLHPLLHRSAP